MQEAVLLVAVILFVLSGVGPLAYREGPGYVWPGLTSLGLAFFAASFLDVVAKN